jgi:hypothetical protein
MDDVRLVQSKRARLREKDRGAWAHDLAVAVGEPRESRGSRLRLPLKEPCVQASRSTSASFNWRAMSCAGGAKADARRLPRCRSGDGHEERA